MSAEAQAPQAPAVGPHHTFYHETLRVFLNVSDRRGCRGHASARRQEGAFPASPQSVMTAPTGVVRPAQRSDASEHASYVFFLYLQVFVGNLSFKTTEEELRTLFHEQGTM